MLDQRGQLLRAALGFAGLPRPSHDRALRALRTWLDSWSGIDRIAVGMRREGFDLQLTQYDARGWPGRVLYHRDGALADESDRFRLGGDINHFSALPRHPASNGTRAGFDPVACLRFYAKFFIKRSEKVSCNGRLVFVSPGRCRAVLPNRSWQHSCGRRRRDPGDLSAQSAAWR